MPVQAQTEGHYMMAPTKKAPGFVKKIKEKHQKLVEKGKLLQKIAEAEPVSQRCRDYADFLQVLETSDPSQASQVFIDFVRKELLRQPTTAFGDQLLQECLEVVVEMIKNGTMTRLAYGCQLITPLLDIVENFESKALRRKLLNMVVSKKQFDCIVEDPEATADHLTTVLKSCEDIELQQGLVELLYRISPRSEKERIEFIALHQIPMQFASIELDTFAEGVREFLGALNESNEAGKKWPKSYRVAELSYESGRTEKKASRVARTDATFWLDFLKDSILIHFELKDSFTIVEIEYFQVSSFEINYESLTLYLLKPLALMPVSDKRPPYTLSMRWKPLHFPTGARLLILKQKRWQFEPSWAKKEFCDCNPPVEEAGMDITLVDDDIVQDPLPFRSPERFNGRDLETSKRNQPEVDYERSRDLPALQMRKDDTLSGGHFHDADEYDGDSVLQDDLCCKLL
ncbi:hypothetical protein HDU97_010310 [Phlyctochytrium planicorne]|nr:hypothetical protein HDU97_010310 [Phlyctochytrium planicorne]